MVSTLTPAPETRLTAAATRGLAAVAPLGALLPAAWITAERLISYLNIYGPAACVMAGAIELLGLQIVATRTALIGRDMPDQTRSMNQAFAGYLIIIVSVNGVLAVAHLWGWDAVGRIVAEMILGLIALPVSALAGVNKQLHAIDTQAAQVKADAVARHAEEIAERERAQDRENARVIELRKLDIAEAATKRAERAAARTSTPKKEPQQTVAYRNKHEMAATLIPAFIAANGRVPSLAEVSAMLGVKASMASTYRKGFTQ